VSQESRKTVHIAIAANAVLAVAKLIAGLLSGSRAMLAEFAHSVADTMDQVFLRISLSLSERRADEEHPFGYGKERFFWAFLASVVILVSGALFSILQGALALTGVLENEREAFLASYVVLGVALLTDGASWLRAFQQTRREAVQEGTRYLEYVRQSKDPTVKTVLLEDSAAIVGVVIAFAGILLHQLTGNDLWDGLASILIGLLLAYVAFALGRNTKALLLGAAARPDVRERIRGIIESHDEVDKVVQLLTMYLGPDSLLVAARWDVAADVDGDRVEQVAEEIDRELREKVPDVTQVFLDPTHREAGVPEGPR
jgi:cation diffusion facilitator family transporter